VLNYFRLIEAPAPKSTISFASPFLCRTSVCTGYWPTNKGLAWTCCDEPACMHWGFGGSHESNLLSTERAGPLATCDSCWTLDRGQLTAWSARWELPMSCTAGARVRRLAFCFWRRVYLPQRKPVLPLQRSVAVSAIANPTICATAATVVQRL
jgi:hypothetical protein